MKDELIEKVILWGGTGQAKVVRPILEESGRRVIAVFDDTKGLPPPFPDVPLYEGWKQFPEWLKEQADAGKIGFCISIGNPHGMIRVAFSERLKKHGLKPVSVIHKSAVIEQGAILGEGCQIMANAVIGAEAWIGSQVIVNTKASVDHETILEDGSEVGPGATLCGLIKVQSGAWVCAGATILPRVTIGRNSVVGAGSVVTRDVPEGVTIVGVPAKKIL